MSHIWRQFWKLKKSTLQSSHLFELLTPDVWWRGICRNIVSSKKASFREILTVLEDITFASNTHRATLQHGINGGWIKIMWNFFHCDQQALPQWFQVRKIPAVDFLTSNTPRMQNPLVTSLGSTLANKIDFLWRWFQRERSHGANPKFYGQYVVWPRPV